MKIGDKVICIDDSNQIEKVLKKGNIYTILNFCSEGRGVFLEEVNNGSKYIHESNFWGHKVERFRPLSNVTVADLITEINYN